MTAYAVCVILALSGCMVGPNFHRPDTSLPAGWLSAQAQEKDAIDQAWWKRFGDSALDQLIDKAIAGNFDLKIAETRIVQARALRATAHGDLLPTVNMHSTDTREGNRLAFPGNLPSVDLTAPFSIYETGFDASWELDLFGGKKRAVEAATADVKAQEAERDSVRVTMLAEVARDYIDIRRYQALLDVAHHTIDIQQRTLRIAKERFDAGSAPGLEVTQANANLTQTQSDLPHYESLVTQTEFSLDVLLGAQPGAAHAIVGEAKPVPATDAGFVLAAPASVIANRPDIRAAEFHLASATAQQGVATAQFFPDVSISGFFGLLSTSWGGFFTAASRSWSGTGNIVWGILNYDKLKANLNLADAKQQEALLTYQKDVVTALADVERSLVALKQEEAHRDLLMKSSDDNQHAVDIAEQRYKEGLSSFLEVLDAQRTYYASVQQAAGAKADAAQDLVSVYKSLGGGWKPLLPGGSAAPVSAPR